MAWDLEELRKSVELRFGTQQRRLVSASLDSILARFAHVEYHISEFINHESEAVEGRSSLDLAKEIFRFHEKRIEDISLKTAAHALAAVQALHSISDITGTAIVFALRGGREWRGYLHQIDKKLSPNFATFEPLIDALRKHKNYVYLDALVNQSKHRNIVSARLNADLTGREKNRYDFIPFERNNDEYRTREIKPFLVDEYNRQAETIFAIGNELNRVAFALRP